jgi:hypothetical protein
MKQMLDYPLIMGLVCFLFLWTGTQVTLKHLRGRGPINPDAKQDFDVVLAAVLTLLGLIIGFTFSMAISRYDQRKNLEEAEANAIGTEYVRADLLPATEAVKVRRLLKDYTEQRILYYGPHTPNELERIAAVRVQFQQELWTAIVPVAAAQPTPVNALVLAGMNDVLNSQGYTHAAWLNRIPVEARALLVLIALLSNTMIVYSARSTRRGGWLLILPLVVAISTMMIADIDSPRGGLIQVSAPNLHLLVAGMP